MNDPRLLRGFLWCGPAFMVLFFIGFVPLAGYLPPPSPGDNAAEVVSFYTDNETPLRVGMCVMMLAALFFGPWGIALAALTRRTEKGTPACTWIQVFSTGIILFTLAMIVLVWSVTSFRAGEIPPETTRTLNDIGFFLFLFDWSPFALWLVSFAIAIFRDQSERPLFPRWVAYLNLWLATMGVPGSLIIFFKSGAFGFSGALGFYTPAAAFWMWMIVMTWAGFRALDAWESEREPPRTEAVAAVGAGR
jgi:hypothetical protein